MGGIRSSFRARLILGAMIWIAAGMAASWFILNAIFLDRVIREIESELDHHATELTEIVAIDAAGRLVMTQPLSDRRFSTVGSGHYWQLEQRGGAALRSGSLGSARLSFGLGFDTAGRERAATVPGPVGSIMQWERAVPVGPARETVLVGVAIESSEIDLVMSDMRWTVGLSLGVIAIGLMFAAFAQVAFGLLPLRGLRQSLAAIRRGEARRLPDTLPSELAPLARGLNDLLAANEEVVRRARVQAGNLAHALKTPLAILMDEAQRLEAAGHSGAAILHECERMRRQIEYQLARARAAASSASATAATPIGPALRSMVSAISRLYRHRGLTFDLELPPESALAACESEDLDELLGNLLDNDGKWARSRVRVSLAFAGTKETPVIRIAVEDDGPGIPPASQQTVFRAGQRLDEQVPGTGLGLAIVHDVVELYGGRTWIDRSDLGGTAIFLELPAVAPET